MKRNKTNFTEPLCDSVIVSSDEFKEKSYRILEQNTI